MNDEEYRQWLTEQTCNICEGVGIKGVAAIPFVPISVAYCQACLTANAHPYGILVTNTAMGGGELDKMHPAWQQMVADTLAHLGKSQEEWNADLAVEVEHFREYDERMNGS